MSEPLASPRTQIQRRYGEPSVGAGGREWALHLSQQAVALHRLADDRLLVFTRLHEWEPQASHVVAEHVERGLDRDRTGSDGKRLEEVGKRFVDLMPGV